jgi:hypothetical protein
MGAGQVGRRVGVAEVGTRARERATPELAQGRERTVSGPA